MNIYYNENDPKAAAWLRNLIDTGLIPPGDVDERSIEGRVTALKGFGNAIVPQVAAEFIEAFMETEDV